MKDELASLKKRKATDSPQEQSNAKKYKTRAEIIAAQEEQYKKELEEKKIREKLKQEEYERELAERYKVEEIIEEKTEEIQLPSSEVIRRLKVRNLPITLFGEDDASRAERLRQIELKEPMEYIKAGEFEGSDFLKALENSEVFEEDIEALKKKKADEDDPDFKIEQRQPQGTEEEILFFFREVIYRMGQKLETRSPAEKLSAMGRRETALYQQSRAFVRPFFRMCKNKSVPKDILKEVSHIVTQLKNKNYVKANDAYYRMAIGNSPWPMGVTMVGIHERSAREKISSSDQAHILNDETQRKYIQAMKRMMTFCQNENPVNPSRCVL
uniref:Pre-mRNA-splicing factor 18 n=1 Tax=Arcella intermedia TaxID=1963864 RepID=A0A6B2LAC3_9EUKA